ncbi:hypothetical protein F2Q68_00002864 [Brassica cretica]|uniref:Uncharacterized protein n=1 Tax=Brassica cretica TaxID=69181 RepID=A0A8S9J9T2_BRACR|nr:hypothetical protein F2Q68_00002864 [Brassica cretica]
MLTDYRRAFTYGIIRWRDRADDTFRRELVRNVDSRRVTDGIFPRDLPVFL